MGKGTLAALVRSAGLCLVGGLLAAACGSPGVIWPPLNRGAWSIYTDTALGFRLDYPAACQVKKADREAVHFVYQTEPIILVTPADSADLAQGKLWFGTPPLDTARLGGRPGWRYAYDFYRGPFYVRTIAVVAPHRNGFLALEFRTARGQTQLKPYHRKVLRSFTFLDESPAQTPGGLEDASKPAG